MDTLIEKVRSRYSPAGLFALWSTALSSSAAERFALDVGGRWEKAARELLEHLARLEMPATAADVVSEELGVAEAPGSANLPLANAPEGFRGRRGSRTEQWVAGAAHDFSLEATVGPGRSKSRRRLAPGALPELLGSRLGNGSRSVPEPGSSRAPRGAAHDAPRSVEAPLSKPEPSRKPRGSAGRAGLRAPLLEISQRTEGLKPEASPLASRSASRVELPERASFGVDAFFDPLLQPPTRSTVELQSEPLVSGAAPGPAHGRWHEEARERGGNPEAKAGAVSEPERLRVPSWVDLSSDDLLREMVRAAARDVFRSEAALREWKRTQF